jgi:hypothetical protein
MRQLMAGLSPRAQELVKTRIQISTADGTFIEQANLEHYLIFFDLELIFK